MKHFEPYFAILDGYEFATPRDRENALWAALWACEVRVGLDEMVGPYRPPLVVIEGPAGCGKTRFARMLSDLAGFDLKFMHRMTPAIFSAAARQGRQVLIFDDLSVKDVDQPLLSQWLTADAWESRALRQKNKDVYPLRCVTVLTGHRLDLSEDLKRRAVFIRLVSKNLVDWKEQMAQRIEEAASRILLKGGSLKPVCAELGARRKLVAKKKEKGAVTL